MHEILNFSSGLNPNAAYTKFRNSTARDWKNLRVDEQGFLEVRDGHTLVYGDEAVSQFFVYKTLIIAVIDGEFMWARTNDDPIEFNDFSPAFDINSTKSFEFHPIGNATGEYIFMGNGTGELTGGIGGQYVIDLEDVFDSENPQDPTAYHPYINKPGTPTVGISHTGVDDDALTPYSIYWKTQAVRVNEDDVDVIISPPSDAVFKSGFNSLKPDNTVDDIDEDSLIDNDGNTVDPRTFVEIETNIPQNELATHADIYRTIRREGNAEGPYYLAGRLELSRGSVYESSVPLDDVGLEQLQKLVEGGERVNWRYVDVDSVRSYVMRPNDDRLYLSYFDPESSRRLFHNFTDHISLPTSGEEVTGLKFLPETPWLAVYTPSQIILVLTDPNPELMRVIGRYGSTDRDEAVGCVAPKSLVAIGRYHYFLGGNKRVYRFAGRNPTWLSHQVQPILNQIEISDTTGIANAYAVAHEGDYYLSYPSRDEDPIHYLEWRGQDLTWREEEVEWKEDSYTPNTTLILDTERSLWYRDGFGVSFFTKSPIERLYGIIHGNIYSLYDNEDGDDSEEIVEWLWRSNRLLMPVQQLVHNINVKIQGAGDVIVKAKTEEGEQTRIITCEDPNHYWGQRAGVNLRGRTLDLTVMGTGPITIDRITINERARRVNSR